MNYRKFFNIDVANKRSIMTIKLKSLLEDGNFNDPILFFWLMC